MRFFFLNSNPTQIRICAYFFHFDSLEYTLGNNKMSDPKLVQEDEKSWEEIAREDVMEQRNDEVYEIVDILLFFFCEFSVLSLWA